METIGRVICYGSGKAPARSWHCTKHIGINRLYYIHAGTGGYLHGGEEFSFRVGGLYYIPYTVLAAMPTVEFTITPHITTSKLT